MGVRIYLPTLYWRPLPGSIAWHLETVLREWAGTPYESGQRFKQRGADCIGAVFGVVDELDGRLRADLPGLPYDTAMHDRATAIGAVRELIRRYSPCVKLPLSAEVEGGDIVVTGMPGGGPGHVQMVGPTENQLWHALPGPGFHQAGRSMFDNQVLYGIYRIEDKWRWTREAH